MFSIEIEINVTWFLFDDRSFSTRSEAEAEAERHNTSSILIPDD